MSSQRKQKDCPHHWRKSRSQSIEAMWAMSWCETIMRSCVKGWLLWGLTEVHLQWEGSHWCVWLAATLVEWYTRVLGTQEWVRKTSGSEVDRLMHSPLHLLFYNCTRVFDPGENLLLVKAQPHSQQRGEPQMPPAEREVEAKTTLSHWSRAIPDPVSVFTLTSSKR